MASSDILTYDQTPPHRPALDELGGGAKVNGTPAPDPVRHATAQDFNQISQQLAALGRVAPIAILQVEQTAGIYSKIAVTGQPSGATVGGFTVTKNGAGDITVSWPSGLLPSPVAKPRASVTGATALLVATEQVSTTSARIRMLSHDGVGTDSHFDLEIF
jgi:hypothetical protein